MYDIASLSDGFIPSSANSYAPGKLSAEGSQWNLKLKSQVEGEDDILFKSAKTEAKELDCLLVYHPDTQTYHIERLRSTFNFQQSRNTSRVTKKVVERPDKVGKAVRVDKVSKIEGASPLPKIKLTLSKPVQPLLLSDDSSDLSAVDFSEYVDQLIDEDQDSPKNPVEPIGLFQDNNAESDGYLS